MTNARRVKRLADDALDELAQAVDECGGEADERIILAAVSAVEKLAEKCLNQNRTLGELNRVRAAEQARIAALTDEVDDLMRKNAALSRFERAAAALNGGQW